MFIKRKGKWQLESYMGTEVYGPETQWDTDWVQQLSWSAVSCVWKLSFAQMLTEAQWRIRAINKTKEIWELYRNIMRIVIEKKVILYYKIKKSVTTMRLI